MFQALLFFIVSYRLRALKTLYILFCPSKPANQRTEVRFASFLSGGFTTMAVINPPENKLAKRTSVQRIVF